MRSLTFFIFIVGFNLGLFAQVEGPLDDIKFYADVIANAGNPIHKDRANKEFSSLFDSWLRSDQFNESDLEQIQWLSIKCMCFFLFRNKCIAFTSFYIVFF